MGSLAGLAGCLFVGAGWRWWLGFVDCCIASLLVDGKGGRIVSEGRGLGCVMDRCEVEEGQGD